MGSLSRLARTKLAQGNAFIAICLRCVYCSSVTGWYHEQVPQFTSSFLFEEILVNEIKTQVGIKSFLMRQVKVPKSPHVQELLNKK